MQPGTSLGGYEILGALGAGKILPHSFTNDPDCVARFKHEARDDCR